MLSLHSLTILFYNFRLTFCTLHHYLVAAEFHCFFSSISSSDNSFSKDISDTTYWTPAFHIWTSHFCQELRYNGWSQLISTVHSPPSSSTAQHSSVFLPKSTTPMRKSLQITLRNKKRRDSCNHWSQVCMYNNELSMPALISRNAKFHLIKCINNKYIYKRHNSIS